MDIIRKNTLLLLKSALFGVPSSIDKLSEGEWETIYDYSKDQSVTALCFEAIAKLPEEMRPSRSLYFHWAMFSEQTEIKYREKKQRLAKFLQLIGDKPKILIIKGFSLARNYSIPSHRWCGDVDIFCFEQSENVDRIMEANGIEVDYSNPRHSMFRIEGLKFENHRYFLYNRKDSEEKDQDTADGSDPDRIITRIPVHLILPRGAAAPLFVRAAAPLLAHAGTPQVLFPPFVQARCRKSYFRRVNHVIIFNTNSLYKQVRNRYGGWTRTRQIRKIPLPGALPLNPWIS